MKAILITLLGIGFAAASLQVSATPVGDPVAGQAKSQTCAACHGPTGNSDDPSFPRLAGQHQDYMIRALLDYESGARDNAIMRGIVAALSRQDMEDLSAFFAIQEGNLRTPQW